MQELHGQTALPAYSFPIAPGAAYTKEVFFDAFGKRIQVHILRLDPSAGIKITAALPDDRDQWGMQQTSRMARAANMHCPGVIGAVNADFFNMANGRPEGAFIRNGITLKDDMLPDRHFFGITRAGAFVIGDFEHFHRIRGDLETAVGGRDLLVWQGALQQPVIEDIPVRHPRTAVCIMPEGTLMLVAVDGRAPQVSEGMTLPQLAKYLRDMGAIHALNLDGGGSSTFVLRMPGEADLKQVNLASDGVERECADALLVRSLSRPDGVCVKAWLIPYQPQIAPGAAVSFSATGLDASGARCAIEGAVQWKVMPESAGGIDVNGMFTANGDACDAEILLFTDDKILGRNPIQIVLPDTLQISADDLLLPDHERCAIRVYAYRDSLPVCISPGCLHMEADESLGQAADKCTLITGDEGGAGSITVSAYGISVSEQIQIGRLPIAFDLSQSMTKWETENASLESVAFPEVFTRTERAALRVTMQGKRASFTGSFPIPRRAKTASVWVCAEKGPLPVLYLTTHADSGSSHAVAMREQPTSGSLWHYMEADLPALPLTPQELWLRIDAEGEPGSRFLLDGLRAIFSVKHDDVTMPEVKKVSIRRRANGRYHITVWAGKDMQKPYATPIAFDRVRVMIDDKEYTGLKGYYGINRGNSTVMLHDIPIPDGAHTLKVCAADCFGNQVWKEYALTSALLQEKEIIL